MSDILLKHWTEPRGILILNIPLEWQYRNPIVEPRTENPPYGFELYENSVGCFQLSCYTLAELAPGSQQPLEPKPRVPLWTRSRMDSEGFDLFTYFGEMDDQALICKYIYEKKLRGDPRVTEQLKLVDAVIDSIVIIPIKDRVHAANLNKFDHFLASLGASYDLLYAAIEAESLIEIVVVSTNIIDALLRQSIVIKKQLNAQSDEIDLKYFHQGESDYGILERAIFKEAFDLGIIDSKTLDRLSEVYNLRNRIVHRYIISPIQTRDLIPIVTKLLELHEVIRDIAGKFENAQIGRSFGIYGHGFEKVNAYSDVEVRRVHSWTNDKHGLERFRKKIGRGKI